MKQLLLYIKIIIILFLFSCEKINFEDGIVMEEKKVEIIIDRKENKILNKQKDITLNKENIKLPDFNKNNIKSDTKLNDKNNNNEEKLNDINTIDENFKHENFEEIIKIGLLVPFSGKNSYLGQVVFKSTEMALFETNSKNIELFPIDSGNSIDSAVSAAKILEEKGVSIIIGPIFSAQAIAVRSVINNNIPLLSFTNDESISKKGLWAFGFTPRQEISAIFSEMNSYNIKNLSVIIPKSAYGNIALEHIFQESSDLNIKVKNIYRYSTFSNSFSDLGIELEQSANIEIDALLLLAGGKKLREISSRAQYRGIDPKKTMYFGISSWNSPQILGEPSLFKGIFIAPEQSSFESFVSRYYKIYGAIPPEIGGLSYDILSLCASGLKESKNINQFFSFLTKSSGFNGVFGYFSLDDKGKISRKFASYQVMKRSFVKKNILLQ